MAKNFIYPPWTRYSCLNCGKCCSKWAIKVEDEKAERLLKFNWAERYPDMNGEELFIRKKSELTPDKAYFIKMRKDAKCPFLESNNFCRIHSDLGYDAKGASCKLFPLTLLEGPKGIHVRLSFYCPAVANNEGKSLNAQEKWLSQSYRLSGAPSFSENLFLADGVPIKYSELMVLESSLVKIMKDERKTFAEKLLLGGALIEHLIESADERDKEHHAKLIREMEKLDFDPLIERVGRPAPSPLRGRIALALFLLQDTKPTARARLVRLPSMFLFLFKGGAVKSHILNAKANLSKLAKVKFDLTEDSSEVLTRYFEQKIIGKRYVEGDLTVEGGWALLCTAYKLIELFAKLKAVSEKRDMVTRSDIIAGAGATDLLAVEHTVFFQIGTTRRLANLILNQPTMYKNVLGAI